MISAFGAIEQQKQLEGQDHFFKNFIKNDSTVETVGKNKFRNPSSLISEATTVNTSGPSSPNLSISSSFHNLSGQKQSKNSVESQCSAKSRISNYYAFDSCSDKRAQNDVPSQIVTENNKREEDMLNLSNYDTRYANNDVLTRSLEGIEEPLSSRMSMSFCNLDGSASVRNNQSPRNSFEGLKERELTSYTAPSENESTTNENKMNHWLSTESYTQQLPQDSAVDVAPGAYSRTAFVSESDSKCWFPTDVRPPTSNPWSSVDVREQRIPDVSTMTKMPVSYSQSEFKSCVSPQFPQNCVNNLSTLQSQINSSWHKSPQSWVDYSRMKQVNKVVEKKMVHEGYETRVEKIPLFRPVDIIDKIVEVPVVQTVDTYVPKVEVVEVPKRVVKPFVQTVEKFIEIPEIHYNDKIVEVPDVQKIVRSIPKVEIREIVKLVPKCEVKVIPKYVEVPIVKVCNKYKEIEEIHEVLKPVVKVQTIDVPRQIIKKVPKFVKQVIEQKRYIPIIEYRDVPVEKITYVPKVKTIEKIRHIPQFVDVEVPQIVHKHQVIDRPYYTTKYRDNYVFVPVRQTIQPVIRPSGTTEYVEVPLHKPYVVTHDTFKPKEYPVTITKGNRYVSTVPCNESKMVFNPDGNSYCMKDVGTKSPVYPLTPQSSFHSLPNYYPSSRASSKGTNSPINSPRF